MPRGGRESVGKKEQRIVAGNIQVSVDAKLEELIRESLETELLSDAEARAIALKSLKLGRKAQAFTQPSRRAVAYLEWICYLVAVQCLVRKRLDGAAANAAVAGISLENGQSRLALASQRKILAGWFNSVYRIFKRLRRFQPNDKKLVLTTCEYLLRNGATNSLDKFLAKVLLHNPRQLDLWLVAIDRQRQAGNIMAAIALAQKAYRFHPTATELRATLKNLTTCVLLAQAAESIQQTGSKGLADMTRGATAETTSMTGGICSGGLTWEIDFAGDD